MSETVTLLRGDVEAIMRVINYTKIEEQRPGIIDRVTEAQRRVATSPDPKGDRVERVTRVWWENLPSSSPPWDELPKRFREELARTEGVRFLAMLDAALPPQAPAPDINEMVRKIRTLKRDERCEFPLSWERGGYNQGLEDAIQIILEAAAKWSEG